MSSARSKSIPHSWLLMFEKSPSLCTVGNVATGIVTIRAKGFRTLPLHKPQLNVTFKLCVKLDGMNNFFSGRFAQIYAQFRT